MYLDHIKEILSEMKEDNLEMELPFAIFMKKLLSVKIQFTIDGLLKYSAIQPDGSVLPDGEINKHPFYKLMYYLQVTFLKEIDEEYKNKETRYEEERLIIQKIFGRPNAFIENSWVSDWKMIIPNCFTRKNLYVKYLKCDDEDDDNENSTTYLKWKNADDLTYEEGGEKHYSEDPQSSLYKEEYLNNITVYNKCMDIISEKYSTRENHKYKYKIEDLIRTHLKTEEQLRTLLDSIEVIIKLDIC